MNESDRVSIARLEENVKLMHEDIKEVITTMKTVKGCVNNNRTNITRIDTTLKDHLSNHKRDLAIAGLIISLIAVIVGIIL